jgi:ABC-type Mn2+/Zn2+ transport system ATPase subunit
MTDAAVPGPGRSEPLIELRHVSCAYGSTVVVDEVDLCVQPGEFLGIVGPSGAGKTTLLKALLGSVRPVHGHVDRAADVRVASVPQLETVDWNFPVTVAEVVAMSLTPGRRWWPRISSDERERIEQTLERLGLAGLGARHIRELSGGQQQRVFLARALVQEPDLLVLDEPTAGIDVRTRHEVLHVLADLNEAPPAGRGIAVVLTTHDLNGLAAHLPRLVCFNCTVLADGSPAEVLTSEVLERTFGAPMEVLAHGGLPVVLDHGDELLRARMRKLSA